MSFWSLLLSVIIHVGGVSLFFFKDSLGFKTKPIILEADQECSVPLEVTAISEISCAPISRPKALARIKPASDDPEKQVVEQLLPEPEPIPEVTETAKEEVKPEPAPKEKEIVTEAEAPVIQALEAKPKEKEKPKPKPKKDQKKSGKKKNSQSSTGQKKQKKQPADFISVLNDMDKDLDEGGSAETPITDPDSKSTYGAPAIGPTMSLSIIDRVRRLLENAWHIPLRANDGKALVVMVRIDMNPDGTVKKAHIDDSMGTPQHAAYAMACDSALRAVAQFRTTPLPLPRECYDTWKVFEFVFKRT
jgi:outer membrane biosynthesis protein TonB